MKIKSIQLKHTSIFNNTKLNFKYHNKPITLILGNQGSGKTTFLRSCFQALTWFSARYKDSRTAGVVMLDQDISNHRLQSKLDIQVQMPSEIASLSETSYALETNTRICSWQLYKTLIKDSVGHSKVETTQLEHMVGLYLKAMETNTLQGLPLIAYYPSERFVYDINLISKNNPAIFQPLNAYELTAMPYTTFARFFEWFREICDAENAQTTNLVSRLIANQNINNTHKDLSATLINSYNQMHAPSLAALKKALETVFPELTNIYLQYLPKLQLMVTYQGKDIQFQQLSNSMRNWIALVGDIVRRMCLLNPSNLSPCLEGDGILLIDQIDHQLDADHCATILQCLNKAFPHVQIIATGHRKALLELAADYQCLSLEDAHFSPVLATNAQFKLDSIYQSLDLNLAPAIHESVILEPLHENQETPESLANFIQQNFSDEQQKQLIELLNQSDNELFEKQEFE